MSEVKVPEGYKQTEVGVIPEDWEVDFIKNVVKITTGNKNTQDKIETGEYPFFVRSQTIERINSYSFDGKGVLTAGDGVGTGKIFHYINGKFDYHQRVYLMYDFKDNIDGYYFYLYFSNNFYDRIMSMTAKSSVDSVRREMIADMNIILPPKKEQIAIATALSDIDNLIGSLEKLIAKKEAIKTGTMQQLLTGKTRLPEFATRDDGSAKGVKQTELGQIPEDWEVKAIAKIVKDSRIPSGLYKDKNSYATGAGTSIIKLGDVFSSNIFDPKSAQRVNVDKSEIERYKVEIGDLIIALASVKLEGVGKVMHVTTLEEETIYDHNVALIRTINNVSSSFLSYIFHSNYFRSLVASKATQVGTTFLKASTILGFELHLPSTKEQTAIATILSDMDAEIQALQQRLNKTRDIKQGMMQQLLTGKVRLAY